jgi:hypothetical protein
MQTMQFYPAPSERVNALQRNKAALQGFRRRSC